MSEERFSPDQQRGLAAVLDEIIPPSGDGTLPGAGALGLAAFVDEALDRTPALRPLIVAGLAAADELARGRGADGFATLRAPERRAALDELSATQPAFLPSLTFHSYVGYYQDGRVIEALGLEDRAPYPRGYDMEPSDFTLLDPVRQRPKLFREP